MQTAHLFGNMNQDDADKDLSAEMVRSAKNLVTKRQSKGLRRTKIRGNSLVISSLLNNFAAENLTLYGSFENTANNKVYFFYKYNDGSEHGYMVVELDGISVSILLKSNNLPHSELPYTGPIKDISVVDNFLHFNIPGNGQFLIDIEKAKNGDYVDFTYDELLLQKTPPVFTLNVSGDFSTSPPASLPTASREFLENKVVKFAYRFQYIDNTVSNFSPLSDQQIGSFAPKAFFISDSEYLTQVPLYYKLFLSGFFPISESVKNIDFAVVDQYLNYSIFETKNRSFFTTEFTFIPFLGNEGLFPVSQSESVKIDNSNPFNPTSSVVFEDRIFQSGGNLGRSNSDFDGVKLSATYSIFNDLFDNGNNNKKPFFKPGGLYPYGVQFLDKKGKRSLAQNVDYVSLPADNDPFRYKINIKTDGATPDWATHFQLLSSRVQNYVTYCYFEGFLLYNFADANNDYDLIASNLFEWNGPVYLNTSGAITEEKYSSIHIVIPKNLPFVPDTSYKVRLRYVPSSGGDEIEVIKPVVDIINGLLVIDPLKEPKNFPQIRIELFKEDTQYENILYENGPVIDIANWGNTFELKGDTYFIDTSNLKNVNWQFPQITARGNGDQLDEAFIEGDIVNGKFKLNELIQTTSQTAAIIRKGPASSELSPGFFSSISFGFQSLLSGSLIPNGGVFQSIANVLNIDSSAKKKLIDVVVTNENISTIDFSKEINSNGRLNIEDKNEDQISLENSIYFSNTKVQNSKVNGLSSFDFQNNYSLPSERGPITKLVATGNGNVILALHPRNTTSLYIGEGFIRQGDDSILAKTEGVIGDDRLLDGGYGCVNIESVVSYKGNVFFWDKYSYELVRYSRAGLTPLGKTYKMKSFFDKWGLLLKDSDLPVIGGFDPFYEMYIVKFPAIGSQESETIGFRNQDRNEGFVTLLDYNFAEIFATSGENLLSGYGNELYNHDGGNVTLYGNEIETEIDFVFNEQPASTKIVESIACNTDKPVTFQLSNIRGQFTDLLEKDFRLTEDTYYADILRDKNTPADQLPANAIALRDGNLIKGQTANIKLKGANTYDEVVISSSPATGQYVNK